jgi:uncharacterized protein (DUF1330 family)
MVGPPPPAVKSSTCGTILPAGQGRGGYPGTTMAKAYWVATYRSISNPTAFDAYAKLAGPAIEAGGGRFVVRGSPAKVYESGLNQRVVIIEFDSVEQAAKAHDSDAYQAALKALDSGADRDIRIVEGLA